MIFQPSGWLPFFPMWFRFFWTAWERYRSWFGTEGNDGFHRLYIRYTNHQRMSMGRFLRICVGWIWLGGCASGVYTSINSNSLLSFHSDWNNRQKWRLRQMTTKRYCGKHEHFTREFVLKLVLVFRCAIKAPTHVRRNNWLKKAKMKTQIDLRDVKDVGWNELRKAMNWWHECNHKNLQENCDRCIWG